MLFNILKLLLIIIISVIGFGAAAHGVDDTSRSFIEGNQQLQIIPFIYIGAKHMVTGYDHLLFLVAVVFLIFNLRDIVILVSLFTLGHSITLVAGVALNWQINAYLVDAIIGLSVVYKAIDNLAGWQTLLGKQLNPRHMVLAFGLVHGLGLASKLQELNLNQEHLIAHLLSFNLGVELGQILALVAVLILIRFWQQHRSFERFQRQCNFGLIFLGMLLTIDQLAGLFNVLN